MSDRRLVVLKFGSSVLRRHGDLPMAAAEVKRYADAGNTVLAVVSAIGRSTEALIARARALGHDALPGGGPSTAADAAFAALLGTGEATSAALLGLALDRVGIGFTILDAGRVGPFTRGPQLDAEPHAFDGSGVGRVLAQRPVAILPGFVGRDESGDFSVLGRGGSDLTALFVAHALGADRCRLLKDVDGVYEHDPRQASTRPRRYATLRWDDALKLDGDLLQRKAVQFAYRHRVPFEVGACGGCRGTTVGPAPTSLRRLAS